LAVLVLFPGSARADRELVRARKLFRQGEIHFNLGEFEKAKEKFTAAYRVKQIPAFLFNIGQCHRQLGNCERALFYFRQFLRYQPNSPQAQQVRLLIRECEKRLEEPTTKPVEAASKPAVLKPDPPQPDPKPPEPKPPPTDERPVVRALFWIGLGLTGVLAVTSGVSGAVAVDHNERFRDSQTPSDEIGELRDRGQKLETTAWTTGALAVASAAATAWFLYQWRFERPSQSGEAGGGTEQLSAVPLRGGAAVSISGSF
jgi:tetratricopeptide (TPR) repeat protein